MHFGIAALLAAIAALPVAQERESRAPQTEQTVSVTRGSRLSIDNFAGEVVIHTWDRDSLRVQARHPSRTRISIHPGPGTVSISATAAHGPAGSVDYDITAPAWMPMKIEGQFNYVTVDGAQSEV